MDFEKFKKDFANKLRTLRNEKKISAREMSLELGQNVNYINYIENGKHMPSMQGFFSICEYFSIDPADFFERHNAKKFDEHHSSDCAVLLEIYEILKKRFTNEENIIAQR